MKRRHLKFVLPVVAVGLALGIWATVTTSSIAATNNANLAVSVSVVDECTMAPANLTFPDYLNSEVNTSALIDVTCTGSTAWNIRPDGGQNSASCGFRRWARRGGVVDCCLIVSLPME